MPLRMMTSRSLRYGATVLALAAAFPVFAQGAPTGGAANAPVRQSVDFITGGIGQDEQERLRQRARDYPLQIQFASGRDWGNAFAAKVHLRILDSQGQTVLEVPAADPIVLANVPNGRYTVEATMGGETKRQTVNVGKEHTNITLVWK